MNKEVLDIGEVRCPVCQEEIYELHNRLPVHRECYATYQKMIAEQRNERKAMLDAHEGRLELTC